MQDQGGEAFRRAAAALKGADKELRKEVARSLRAVGKPLGQKIVQEASAGMPRKGGLAARIAKTKISQTNSTSSRNPKITLALKSADGYDLPAMDRGRLRHLTFGHRPWRTQQIEPNLFSTPFEKGAPEVQKQLMDALEKVAEDIKHNS